MQQPDLPLVDFAEATTARTASRLTGQKVASCSIQVAQPDFTPTVCVMQGPCEASRWGAATLRGQTMPNAGMSTGTSRRRLAMPVNCRYQRCSEGKWGYEEKSHNHDRQEETHICPSPAIRLTRQSTFSKPAEVEQSYTAELVGLFPC